jgi:hypothetical protein
MKILLALFLLLVVFSQHLGRKRYRYAHHLSPTPVVPYPIPASDPAKPDMHVYTDQESSVIVVPPEVPDYFAPSTEKAPESPSTDPLTLNEAKDSQLTSDEHDDSKYGSEELQTVFSNDTISNLIVGSGLPSNGSHLENAAPQLRNTFNSSGPEWSVKFDFPGKKK